MQKKYYFFTSCHHSCLQLRRYVFEFWYREKTFIDEVAEIMKSVSLNKNYYFVQITTQRQSCLTKVERVGMFNFCSPADGILKIAKAAWMT